MMSKSTNFMWFIQIFFELLLFDYLSTFDCPFWKNFVKFFIKILNFVNKKSKNGGTGAGSHF